MTSFSTDMQNEKIVAIALVAVIVGALSVYLVTTYYPDIIENLFGEKKGEEVIALGDCVDVNYVGKFANGTIFATSYEDVAVENGIYDENDTYEPLKIFIDPERSNPSPDGYENYTSYPFAMIAGFIGDLVGMKEGENKSVTISSEDAYGNWNATMAEEMGMGTYPLESVIDCIEDQNKSTFSMYFPDVSLTINNTFDYGAVFLGINDTLNATITNITDTNVTYNLLPENGTTFIRPILNWNETFIVENDTAFTMRTDVKINHTFSIYGVYHFKVIDVNETSAKLTMNAGAPDIKFIGQTLVFELEVVNIYKTS
jgi:hypothetical protein